MQQEATTSNRNQRHGARRIKSNKKQQDATGTNKRSQESTKIGEHATKNKQTQSKHTRGNKIRKQKQITRSNCEKKLSDGFGATRSNQEQHK